MRALFFSACLLLVLGLAVPHVAQAASADGEVVDEPICFNVVSQAPYTVYGSFITNFFTRDDGARARHRSNFRLETNQKAEFCTYGPFYEGRKLELVIRTLVPVFTCKTALSGDIVVSGRRKPEGGTETWAACLEQ